MVEVQEGVRHHRQDPQTQSREYGVFGYLIVCFSLIVITVPVEARRNLSARGNNTQIRRARCGRMRYKKRVRQGRHRLTREDHQTDKRSCVANAWTQDTATGGRTL